MPMQRVKCPSCPDGNLWNKDGPTTEACPTCGGNAFIWELIEDETDVDMDEEWTDAS